MEIQDLSFGLSVIYNSETENVCRSIGFFPGFAQRVRLESYNYKGSFGNIEICSLNKLYPIPLSRTLLEALGFKEIVSKDLKAHIKEFYTNIYIKNFDLNKDIDYPFYGIFNELYIDLNSKSIILKENNQEFASHKQTILWENPKEELYLHFLQKIVWDYFKVNLFKNVKIDKKILTEHIFPK